MQDVAKKPYQKPELFIHGGLSDLTRSTDVCYGSYDNGGVFPNIYLSATSCPYT
jgi:hypothetical protein